MSHQSGIRVSEELAKTFADAVASGNTRILRVSIVKESLEANGTIPVDASFEQDYNKVLEYLEDSTPSYILIRLDDKASTGEYNWLLVSYVPDNAKVRDKMLYASTRATLTKELGDNRFTDSVYGTTKDDVSYDGYKKHVAHKKAEAPLTQRERELAEIKQAEANTASDYQGSSSRRTYAPGITFPLTDKALDALRDLQKSKDERKHNFVSLYLEKETVELDTVSDVSINAVHSTVSANAPRFTFYALTCDGNEAVLFIYTCPSSSKIRERMVYSTSKANVITNAETEIGLQVTKKLETSDPSDLTEDYLLEEVRHIKASAGHTSAGAGVSVVEQRIQMLSGPKQGGFKRPVAPGRRRPGGTGSVAAAVAAAANNNSNDDDSNNNNNNDTTTPTSSTTDETASNE
ncbi:hypothetical protein BDB00DRAFT_817177 [Zychaea mexicana]|uniref:uncharacterized protein n=1 Tax=Zychaea mexicana TaxID=64656 RepID=UPI0022FDD855|nr:uncharacterized protein BDB00DRAFT_817177 [Zychaea mexicana]KAI9494813.1 hypothetical protein BDB00DRAFT_817177 [Zychaea mexicana]